MKTQLALDVPLLALCFALCACASAGRGGTVTVPVIVHNNLAAPASVTIFLAPREGADRELGTIIGSRTDTLEYVGLPLMGEYRLVARRADNRTMSSMIIVLTGVSEISW